jgi:hypothetical protein
MPQMNDFEIGHLFMVTKSLSGALLKALKADGTNIFVANGAIAGQKAPHFMAHVIPRKEGDKLTLNIPEHKISIAELLKIRDMLLPKVKIHLGLSDIDIESMVAETAALNQATKETPIAAQSEKNPVESEKIKENSIPSQEKKIAERLPEHDMMHEFKSPKKTEEADLDAISNIINPRKNIAPRLTSKDEITLTEEQRKKEEDGKKAIDEKKDRQRKITLSEIEGLFKHKDR